MKRWVSKQEHSTLAEDQSLGPRTSIERKIMSCNSSSGFLTPFSVLHRYLHTHTNVHTHMYKVPHTQYKCSYTIKQNKTILNIFNVHILPNEFI